MKECFADYADSYEEYKSFIYSYFKDRPPVTGYEAQCNGLHFLSEDELSERERLIMMLSVIKWEIDHNMLTNELEGELDYYYDELTSGRLKKHIHKKDLISITKDLTDCYNKVFG